MQRLISSLFHNWYGQPILVIAGGPSVADDLPKLDITPACVISANDHGFRQRRFPITLVVNGDKKHMTAPDKPHMNDYLRAFTSKYGGAIVNKFSFADYRLGDWNFASNSGDLAVAVACALGGNPVIVTGIDRWNTGRRYFHDGSKAPAPPRVKRKYVKPTPDDRSVALGDFCRGANVRPMSGPMTLAFPVYRPDEALPKPQDIAYRRKHLNERPVYVTRDNSWKYANQDIVPAGTTMALTPQEVLGLQQSRRLV